MPVVKLDTTCADVIIVVDSSAALSGVYPQLLKDYILPCVEHFRNGWSSDVPTDLQYGPVQYGLVTMNSQGICHRPACTYYPVTCDAGRLMQLLKEIRFEGGLVEKSVRLSEGFAAALELSDLMKTTREPCRNPELTVEKHCILVCNLPPSPHRCLESMNYGGKNHEQLTKLMIERQISLSVIAPRNLPFFRGIFEKSLLTGPLEPGTWEQADHSLCPGHLVLLQGFHIEAIKAQKVPPKPETLAAETKPSLMETTPSTAPSEGPQETTIPPTTTTSAIQPMELSTSAQIITTPEKAATAAAATTITVDAIAQRTSPVPKSMSPVSLPVAPTPRGSIGGPGSVPEQKQMTSEEASPSLPKLVSSPPTTTVSFGVTVPGSTSRNPIQIGSPFMNPDRSFSSTISQSFAIGSSASSVTSAMSSQAQVPSIATSALNTVSSVSPFATTANAQTLATSLGPVAPNRGGPSPISFGTSTSQASISSQPGPTSVPGPLTSAIPSSISSSSVSATASIASSAPNVGLSTGGPPSYTETVSMNVGIPGTNTAVASQSLPSASAIPTFGGTPTISRAQTNIEAARRAAEMAKIHAEVTALKGPYSSLNSIPIRPGRPPVSITNIPGQQASISSGLPTGAPANVVAAPISQPSMTRNQTGLNLLPSGSITSALTTPSVSIPSSVSFGASRMPSQPISQPGLLPSSMAPPGVTSMAGPQIGGPVPSFGGTATVSAQAGMPQAGMPQAGMPQAGMPQAGMPQAGMPQAGMPQAGMPQAGMSQAGMPQAGIPQASSQAPQPQMMHPQPFSIWNGHVELVEVRGNQKQTRQIQCTVTTTKTEIIQDIKPDQWPPKMTMNAYPRIIFNHITQLMNFTQPHLVRTVTFNFMENPQTVTILRLLMSTDVPKHFAIVQLPGAGQTCPIRALILVWNEKQNQFTGLIPLQQDRFVAVIKQVFTQRAMNTVGVQSGVHTNPMVTHVQMQQQTNPMMASQSVSMPGIQATATGQVSYLSQQRVQPQAHPQSQTQPMAGFPSASQPMNLPSMQTGSLVGGTGAGMQSMPGAGMVQQQQLPTQPPRPLADRQAQLEKIIYVLDNSSPEQQQQIFAKIRATPEQQQQLMARVQAKKIQRQQQQRQQIQMMQQSQQQQMQQSQQQQMQQSQQQQMQQSQQQQMQQSQQQQMQQSQQQQMQQSQQQQMQPFSMPSHRGAMLGNQPGMLGQRGQPMSQAGQSQLMGGGMQMGMVRPSAVPGQQQQQGQQIPQQQPGGMNQGLFSSWQS